MPEERTAERLDEPPVPTRPAKKKRRLPIVALVVVGVILALLAVPWAARHTIATSMAQDRLAAAGLVCDERFSVELSALLGSATIQPTRCTAARGHVEAIELTAPLAVELSGLSPAAIDAQYLRLTLSEELAGGSGWDAQLARLHLEARVAGLVKALAELSELPLPPTRIARAEVRRGDEAMAELHGVTLTPGDPLATSMERVVFSAVGGAGQLTLENVSGTAEPSRVRLEGEATARAAISFFGALTRRGTFTLDATALDQARPQFVLRSTL